MRTRAISTMILAAALALAGCSKKDDTAAGPKAAPVTAGTVGADGIRRVPVEAGATGYAPARIEGKPGEKLVLVFTRTADGECMEKVKIAGGQPVDLPKGTAVEIPVEVPASGKLAFACGMDMVTGEVVPVGT